MKTSVWLPDDVAAEWKEREIPLAELVRRGLAADEPEPLDEKLGRLLDDRLEPVTVELAALRRLIERAAGETHG